MRLIRPNCVVCAAALALAAGCASPEIQPVPVPSPAIAAAGAHGEPGVVKCVRSGDLFRVFGNIEWCDTGIVVARGDHISIRAKGLWSNRGAPTLGPEGYGSPFPGTLLDGSSFASLIAEVGVTRFEVGKVYDGEASDAGHLLLAQNDLPGQFLDNSGYLDVRVTVGGH